tara:strand:+ start:127 stop:270 length:144 start_codon:yes stop_codon:yes gene_type:complete
MRMERGYFLRCLCELIALKVAGEPRPNTNVTEIAVSIFVEKVFLENG